VEYVLLVALVATALVLALVVFRNGTGGTLNRTTTTLQAVPGSSFTPGGTGGRGRGGGVGGGRGSGS